jgi:hypothetical protein
MPISPSFCRIFQSFHGRCPLLFAPIWVGPFG